MAQKKGRSSQTSPGSRQAFIGGRLDTSQTIRSAGPGGSSATATPYQMEDEEEFPISVERGRRKPEVDGWSMAATIGTWVAVLLTLGGALLFSGWYFSKADTALSAVQGEVRDARIEIRDVRTRVDKLAEETTKQGAQLGRIEKSASQFDSDIRELRATRKADSAKRN